MRASPSAPRGRGFTTRPGRVVNPYILGVLLAGCGHDGAVSKLLLSPDQRGQLAMEAGEFATSFCLVPAVPENIGSP